MKKDLVIIFGSLIFLMLFLFSINSQAQKKTISSNYKTYTVGNYQIIYANGAKMEWFQVADYANEYYNSDLIDSSKWRLPSIEELTYIYKNKKVINLYKGVFWSMSHSGSMRRGLFNCIDFASGEESLNSNGRYNFLLLKIIKNKKK